MFIVASPPGPKPPTETLSAQLSVSLTAGEKVAVASAAKASGLSMSAWGRQAINAALNRRAT